MDEYIKREEAIAYIREQSEECQKAFEELGGESGIYADAYNDLAEDFYSIPAADVAPVVHGLWIPIRESEMTGWDPAVAGRDPIGGYICSACKEEAVYDCNDEFVLSKYCPNCGAIMDGGNSNAVD